MCLMNVMVRTLMSYLSYTEIRGFLMLLLCVPCDSWLCFCGTEHSKIDYASHVYGAYQGFNVVTYSVKLLYKVQALYSFF